MMCEPSDLSLRRFRWRALRVPPYNSGVFNNHRLASAAPKMSINTDKRAKEILRLLLSHGRASVEELTAALGTSPASVRRDLVRLEARGLVNRTLGGAMLANHGGPVYEPFRFDASFQV